MWSVGTLALSQRGPPWLAALEAGFVLAVAAEVRKRLRDRPPRLTALDAAAVRAWFVSPSHGLVALTDDALVLGEFGVLSRKKDAAYPLLSARVEANVLVLETVQHLRPARTAPKRVARVLRVELPPGWTPDVMPGLFEASPTASSSPPG